MPQNLVSLIDSVESTRIALEAINHKLGESPIRKGPETDTKKQVLYIFGATRQDRTGDLLITKLRFHPYAIDSVFGVLVSFRVLGVAGAY